MGRRGALERRLPVGGPHPRVRTGAVGRAAALGGADTAPNPVEQLLGSLGNCLAVGYAANATVAGIAIRDLRIELAGDVDLHAFLGLRDGHAGFDDIRVTVHLDADASPDELRRCTTRSSERHRSATRSAGRSR